LRNPVKAKLARHPADWLYSSAREYYGFSEPDLTDTEEMLSRFKTMDAFKNFIDEKDDGFDYNLFR
jgi:hypothetical protein